MDLFELLTSYNKAFDESPPIFGLGIAKEKPAVLIQAALERGTPLTEAELCAAAGVEDAPPGAII